MFVCTVCRSHVKFALGDAFMAHFIFMHSKLINQGTLNCPFAGCFRTFGKLNSFRKHVLQHKVENVEKVKIAPDVFSSKVEEDCFDVMEIPCDGVKDGSHFETEKLVNTVSDKLSISFDKALTDAVVSFTAGLYDSGSFNDSQIQYVIDSHKQLLGGGFLTVLQNKVLSLIPENSSDKRNIVEMFQSCENMFEGYQSQHLRLKELENSGAFIRPVSFVIGPAEDIRAEGGHPVVVTVELEGQHIPMSAVLKGFLELPNVFKQVCAYVEKLESTLSVPNNKMSNLIQGKLWQTKIKPLFQGKFVLPLTFGFDDYEPNKELGSRTGAHKLGAGYIRLPFLPTEFQGALENIFLAVLFHSGDQSFGNRKIFRKLLAELKSLEENGISVVTEDGQRQVYFALALVIGDNLGANGILGFVESFSAHYFCRVCSEKNEIIRKTIVVNPAKVRTPESYANDLRINDVSLTGVKEECVFNELKAFHVAVNRHLDLMHDFDEGIMKYVMYAVISYFYKNKRCSIDYLNELIQGFYYGPNEEKNRSPPISQGDLVKNKHLRGSASETRCLVRYFGLIFGCLVKDIDHEVWNVYLLLRKLVDILSAPCLSVNDAQAIGVIMRQHHKAYMEVFGLPLQPKFHLALHYEDIIIDIGPPDLLSCYRIEAKHKEGKKVARDSNNRINLHYTVAKRHQLKVASRFLSDRGLVRRFEYTSIQHLAVNNINGFSKFHAVVPSEHMEQPWDTVKSLQLNGVKYCVGGVVVLAIDAPNSPMFSRIHTIKIIKGNDAYFVVKLYKTIRFEEHYHAYHVEEDNRWLFVNIRDLVTYVATDVRTLPNRKLYIPFRFSLQCLIP